MSIVDTKPFMLPESKIKQERTLGIVVGVVAFLAPSTLWLSWILFLGSFLRASVDYSAIFAYIVTDIHGWVPFAVFGVTSIVLGFGLANKRNKTCLIFSTVVYFFSLIAVAIWLDISDCIPVPSLTEIGKLFISDFCRL